MICNSSIDFEHKHDVKVVDTWHKCVALHDT